jgi:hypothetical protein
MENYSSFDFDGKRHSISVELFDARNGLGGAISQFLFLPLIEEIAFTNSINDPILKATVTYIDTEARVLDSLNGNLNVLCRININIIPIGKSSEFVPNESIQKFSHTFYLNSLDITETATDRVEYKLHLISSYFFPFMETKSISTFSGVKTNTKPFLSLMKNVLGEDLPLRTTVKDSNINIEYISPAGTSRMDSIKKILSKNVESPDSDLTLLVYDSRDDIFELWFKSQYLTTMPQQISPIYENIVMLNMNDDPIKRDAGKNKIVSLKSKSFKTPNQDVIHDVARTIEHSFDYESRSFSTREYTNQRIKNSSLLGGRFNNIDYSLFKAGDNVDLTIEGIDPEGLNFYQRIMKVITENNSIQVTVPGNINRKPGIPVTIGVGPNENLKDISGTYILTKLIYKIRPQDEIAVNDLLLGRDTYLRDKFEVKNKGIKQVI